MPDSYQEVKCSRCGYTWNANLTEIDRQQQQWVYKSVEQERKYTLTCPNCGTHMTLRIREHDHGHR